MGGRSAGGSAAGSRNAISKKTPAARIDLSLSQNAAQPWTDDATARRRHMMPTFDQMKLHVGSAPPQPFRVPLCDGGSIKSVAVPGDVQHRRSDRLVRAIVPIARQAAANADDAAYRRWMSRGETIIQRDRLREAHQDPPLRRDAEFAAGFFEDVQHHLVMERDGFRRPPVGIPAETDFARGLPQKELIRALERRDHRGIGEE